MNEPITHSAIHPGEEDNTLLVILRAGRRLEVYVNGVAVSRPIQLEQPLTPRVRPALVAWSKVAEISEFTTWLLPPPALPGPGDGNHAPDLAGLKPIIDDTFSDPDKSVFRPEQDDKGFSGRLFTEGRFVIRYQTNPRDERATWGDCDTSVEEEFAGDVACQVTGRVLGEREFGWEVGLATPDSDRDVAVRLRRDGTVEVGKFALGRQGVPVLMAGPIRHPAIHPGDQDNTLLVILRGGQTLEIYVNGEAVARPIRLAQRLTPVSPGVGLSERGARGKEGRAEFRRFTAWKLP
jgi:hypothetical protein